MIVGFIRDYPSWQALLVWVAEQNFADHADKPESIPFRIENILREKLETWDGTKMEWAKGYVEGHYAVKKVKAPTREELLAKGQMEMPMETA